MKPGLAMDTNDTSRICLAFRCRWTRRAERQLLLHLTAHLTGVTGRAWTPEAGWFGGIFVCDAEDVLFVRMIDNTRPSRRCVGAVDLRTRTNYLPSIYVDDLVRVYAHLHATSAEDMVAVHQAVHGDYGMLVKGQRPVRVATESDAIRCGLEGLRQVSDLLREERSLWWQPWGGHLLTFSVEIESSPPHVCATTVAICVGNWKLPPA